MNTEVMFSNKSDEWSTPQDFFDKLHEEFAFNLDPCCTHENAKCRFHFTREEDGLRQPWNGSVFVNPPYSQLKVWIGKGFEEAKRGTTVVMLIPARTDAVAFHKYILPFAGINSARLDYVWAAGIIDGEGCIRIDKVHPTEANRLCKPSYALLVAVKMTDFPTIKRLASIFGEAGSVYEEKREVGRDLRRWEVRGEAAKRVLECVYPHLTTKQYQAQRGLEFQELKIGKVGRRVSENYLILQEAFYNEISQVKKQQSNPGIGVELRFIRGRLKFGGAKNSAPFPSALVIFRPKGTTI